MIKILESIAEKELYMGYIFGIMILGGYIREYRVLDDVYSLAKKYIKDNRLMIIVTSIFGGVLPIPGRVALSAPLLDAIAPPTKRDRSNYGIIDYLSTHHYYWWSPLEKTIILPMAALGITYREMLSYLLFHPLVKQPLSLRQDLLWIHISVHLYLQHLLLNYLQLNSYL